MPPVQLKTIATSFEREMQAILEHLKTTFHPPLVQCAHMGYSPLADGCLVSIWDAWGRAIRGLILTCAAGPTIGESGQIYVPNVLRTEDAALKHLVAAKTAGATYSLAFGKRGEPKWYFTTDTYDICQTLGLANTAIISGALTATQIDLGNGIALTNPNKTIQTVRNYIAHKSSENRAKMEGVCSVTQYSDMEGYLRSRTAGGSELMIDWADAQVAMVQAAAL